MTISLVSAGLTLLLQGTPVLSPQEKASKDLGVRLKSRYVSKAVRSTILLTAVGGIKHVSTALVKKSHNVLITQNRC